jgi:outer membrane protein OmpA-like peptidoglycan-associated protein
MRTSPSQPRWLVALLAVALSGLTSADAEAGKLDWLRLRGFFGVRTFSDSGNLGDADTTTLSNSAQLGLRAQADLVWRLLVEAEVPVLVTSTRDDRATAFVTDPRVQAVLDFNGLGKQRNIRPLLSLGAGMPLSLSGDTDVLRGAHVVPEAFFGVGARFERRTGWSIRVDVRANVVPARGDRFITPEFEVLFSLYRRRGARSVLVPKIEVAKVNPDPDGDGVLGERDQCPNRPEDRDNFADDDGCPDIDDDRDEILDIADKCRLDAETRNGFRDNDGCPDEIPADLARYLGVLKGVRFRRSSALLRSSSRRYLRRLAKVLTKYPSVRVKIIGHTDNTGNPNTNQELSLRRASAVANALIALGVSEYSVIVIAHGSNKPIADNDTARGRAKNRRVELKLWTREER